MNLNECFECNSKENICRHHVVPKSKGGTKTIPLCVHCHSIVHDRNLVKHYELLLKAVAKAKLEGKYKGRKKGSVVSNEAILKKYSQIVDPIISEEMSLRKIASTYGVSLGTIQKVKRILKSEKNI
jgi:hypothetical protein